PRRLPENGESAEQPVLPHQGNGERRSIPGADEHLAGLKRLSAVADVGHLDRFPRAGELPRRALPLANRRRDEPSHDFFLEVLGCSRLEELTTLVVLVDHAGIGARQLRGSRDDRAEHGLKIQRRTDRLTDLAEGPKLTHRARQVLSASFELLEQPYVLGCEDRLISEGLEWLDLLVGEGPQDRPSHCDGAERPAIPEHRHRENGPEHTQRIGHIGLLADVSDLDDGGCADRPRCHTEAARWLWEGPLNSGGLRRRPAVLSREMD